MPFGGKSEQTDLEVMKGDGKGAGEAKTGEELIFR